MFTNNLKTLSTVLAALLTVTAAAYAGGVGTTGAQFLKIGQGARAVAMGGAFSAIADNADAIYWNPAGLAGQDKRQVTASYSQYIQGINYGFIGYTQELCKGVMGLGLNYLSVTDIERRTLDTDTNDGTFGANDSALYLSYGTDVLSSKLSLGANLKVIKQTLDTQSAQSYALDLAGLYKTPIEKLTASLGVYNIGTQVKFVDEGDPLPLDVRAGLAYRMFNNNVIVAADVNDYIVDERLYTQVGAEYNIGKIVSIRGGYTMGMDSDKLGGMAGLSTGFGVHVWDIQLDYAFVPMGELNDTNRITISTKF
jgi:hypothetical protein